MKKQKPKYSLVIPALEEEGFIEETLITIRDYLKAEKIYSITEIVVVTSDSKDNTKDIVLKHARRFKYFQFIEPGPRVGKGRDVKAGVIASRGDYVLFTDADLATPLHHVLPAFKLLEEGNDVVMGKRSLWRIHSGIRRVVSLCANTVTRFLVAPNISDTQCGFKGFTKKSAKLIFNDLTVLGWAFDMEIIAISRQKRLRLVTLSILDWKEYKPDDKQLSGESNLRAAAKSLREASRIGVNRLKGKYR